MEDLSNVTVSYWLTNWCKETNVNPKTVSFKIDYNEHRVFIYTPHPGFMIGYHGDIINQFRKEFNNLLKDSKIEESYEICLVEVTTADFWVNYDWMSEGF